jgi:flavin reductase (DIM6/NTAB) family NADH-FMN oxidoreductase RutF
MIDSARFREVLGQYPTGVVIVTAMAEDGPVGMTVGSFTSVSLDPPMVAFLPAKSSSSWAALRDAGDHFTVNILASDQEDVCRLIAMRKTDKFKDVEWHESGLGNPIIQGAVAIIDCTRVAVHDAGDHEIVVGEVKALEVRSAEYPLLFFRGGYGSFKPASLAAAESDLMQHLGLVNLVRPSMERLAERFETEVTTNALVGRELALTASAGRSDARPVPTRVGMRLPFAPPAAAVFAAWGTQELRDLWISSVNRKVPRELLEEFKQVPDRVQKRGYAVTFGQHFLEVESLAAKTGQGALHAPSAELHAEMLRYASAYNPASVEFDGLRHVQFVSVPIFDGDKVAFQLTLWGPRKKVSQAELLNYVDALQEEAALASAAIQRVGERAQG